MTSVRVGEGGSPYQPPQPLSTHSSDSFFGHLGFREFFASVCPILNPLISPVSSLNLSFQAPGFCFCPSPLLHPCRGTGNPLSSLSISLSGPGPCGSIGGPGQVFQTTLWGTEIRPEHEVLESREHPQPGCRPPGAKEERADERKRVLRRVRMTSRGLPDRTERQAEVSSLSLAALLEPHLCAREGKRKGSKVMGLRRRPLFFVSFSRDS